MEANNKDLTLNIDKSYSNIDSIKQLPLKKDKDKVLVTGANGYVASWIVKKLLDEGHSVHATVRDITDTSKTVHLKSLEKASSGKCQQKNIEVRLI